MPIYEEKLINPLALRFTQDHIRTTFRDGRPVEPTIEEIEIGPGTGDYDVVLRAPFPNIEIIRWSAPERAVRESHWFTLDNRRLYCLQRAAVALLPKRVAAIVEILYADAGHVWRKYDSETEGRMVTISHSCKQAPIRIWHWQDAILPVGRTTVKDAYIAHQAMVALRGDDCKTQIDDLQDLPCDTSEASDAEPPDAIQRAEQHLTQACAAAPPAALDKVERALSILSSTTAATSASSRTDAAATTCAPTAPSASVGHSHSNFSASSGSQPGSTTTSPRNDQLIGVGDAATAHKSPPSPFASSSPSPFPATISPGRLGKLRKRLEAGYWTDRKGDRFELKFASEASWSCVRVRTSTGEQEEEELTIVSFDEQEDVVWWGKRQEFYFRAVDLLSSKRAVNKIEWYAESDWSMINPCFAWTRSKQTVSSQRADSSGQADKKQQSGKPGLADTSSKQAAKKKQSGTPPAGTPSKTKSKATGSIWRPKSVPSC